MSGSPDKSSYLKSPLTLLKEPNGSGLSLLAIKCVAV
jgi:hypothetical protein